MRAQRNVSLEAVGPPHCAVVAVNNPGVEVISQVAVIVLILEAVAVKVQVLPYREPHLEWYSSKFYLLLFGFHINQNNFYEWVEFFLDRFKKGIKYFASRLPVFFPKTKLETKSLPSMQLIKLIKLVFQKPCKHCRLPLLELYVTVDREQWRCLFCVF